LDTMNFICYRGTHPEGSFWINPDLRHSST
jgi:hypothetical protein